MVGLLSKLLNTTASVAQLNNFKFLETQKAHLSHAYLQAHLPEVGLLVCLRMCWACLDNCQGKCLERGCHWNNIKTTTTFKSHVHRLWKKTLTAIDFERILTETAYSRKHDSSLGVQTFSKCPICNWKDRYSACEGQIPRLCLLRLQLRIEVDSTSRTMDRMLQQFLTSYGKRLVSSQLQLAVKLLRVALSLIKYFKTG
jgi:hypothetical protein